MKNLNYPPTKFQNYLSEKSNHVDWFFLRVPLVIILLFLNLNTSFSQCSECLTNLLPLNTGFDYEHNTLYNLGEPDQYWQLTQGAGGISYPRCATALHASDLGSFGSSKISINSTASADGNMNMSMLGGNCVYTGTGYIFRRDFCVNTGTGNPLVPGFLKISQFANDLNVSEIFIITPSGAP
ncbi:MAG TPA: hypothetical protein PLU10_09755, partial [Chitinophagaceae bacterium]|nr:hypothetical protein [Chitinophagaceae bacterium]